MRALWPASKDVSWPQPECRSMQDVSLWVSTFYYQCTVCAPRASQCNGRVVVSDIVMIWPDYMKSVNAPPCDVVPRTSFAGLQATDLPHAGSGLTWPDLEQWIDLNPDVLVVDALWAVKQV